MSPVLSQIEIHFGDVRVEIQRRRSIKTKASGVESISVGIIIGRVSLSRSGQVGKSHWIYSDAREQVVDIRSTQGRDSTLGIEKANLSSTKAG